MFQLDIWEVSAAKKEKKLEEGGGKGEIGGAVGTEGIFYKVHGRGK